MKVFSLATSLHYLESLVALPCSVIEDPEKPHKYRCKTVEDVEDVWDDCGEDISAIDLDSSVFASTKLSSRNKKRDMRYC